MKGISEKLHYIQQNLKCNKNQFNVHAKFKYRSCEDILEAVKPLCVKNNVLLTITDDIVLIGDRFYVKATATVTNLDGASVSASALAREEDTKKGMDGSQVTGASSSYARKYALNGLFCIDDTKDADATNTHGKEQPVQQPTTTPQPAPTATYQMAISALNACTTAAETIQVCKTWETRVGDQVDAFKNECRAMYNKLSKAS
jgi:hypothetical protein